METKVLNAIFGMAASQSSSPAGVPIYPENLTKFLGISESDLEPHLISLKNKGLLKFPSLGTNIVALTPKGVEVAEG